MSDKQKIHRFPNLRRLVTRLRDDLNGGGQDFVLLYAYNGTGKTRLSMAFKDAGKRKNKGQPDTLYFNAFTEDLFSWDNDLEKDSERRLHINTDSQFFKGLKELALDERIGHYLARYADFLFDIDYDQWTVSFRKGETRHIKVSRGEENIFIWCVFMAGFRFDGLGGQFMLGGLLGIVWSPCVGPTLGAAITLASQGQSLGQVTLLMAVFGLGAGFPLVVLGRLSRQALAKARQKLNLAGQRGKQVLGAFMLLIGALILSGADKAFEAWVLQHAPDWLVRLTTSI